MFSQRLKQLRTEKKMTHEAMANYLGITRQGYGNYENGSREPDFETTKKIAEFFDVTVDFLLDGEKKTQPDYPEFFTSKDKRDLRKFLEEDKEVMFDGVPLSEEDKEKVARVMEAMFIDAKKQNKHKKKTDTDNQ